MKINTAAGDSRSPIRSRTSFAGVTALDTFYETITILLHKIQTKCTQFKFQGNTPCLNIQFLKSIFSLDFG